MEMSMDEARTNLGADQVAKRIALLALWQTRETAERTLNEHIERVAAEQREQLDALEAEYAARRDAILASDVSFAAAKTAHKAAEDAYHDFEASDLGDVLVSGELGGEMVPVMCALSGLVITDSDDIYENAQGVAVLADAGRLPKDLSAADVEDVTASAQEAA